MTVPLRDNPARRVVLAVLIALLMIPFTVPTVEAQTNLYQLSIHQGDAIVTQGESTGTWFFSGNSTDPVVRVKVYNTGGSSPVSKVPVYVYSIDDDYVGYISGCGMRDIPPGTPQEPSLTNVTVFLTVPPWRENNATSHRNHWTFRILVGREPPSGNYPITKCAGATIPGPSPTGPDQDATDNVAFFSLVRDLRPDFEVGEIQWCKGVPNDDNMNECAPTVSLDSGVYYNTTRRWQERDGDNSTYFAVSVTNPNGTWQTTADNPDAMKDHGDVACTIERPNTQVPNGPRINMTDYDHTKVTLDRTSCRSYYYDLDIRVAPLGASALAGERLVNSSRYTNGVGTFHSLPWSLVNRTGPFAVYAEINRNGALFGGVRELLTTNNARVNDSIMVSYAELRPEFVLADFRTSQADAYPYPVGGSVTIQGRVKFLNDGPSPTLTFQPGEPPAPQSISWRVYLDGGANNVTGIKSSVKAHDDLESDPWIETFKLTNHTSIEASDYIAPGIHKLCAVIDTLNETSEPNEVNNTHCIDIYIQDNRAPVIGEMFGSFAPRLTPGPWNGDVIPPSGVHPNEPFLVNMNATDEDQSHLNVSVEFTLSSNSSVKRVYYPCPPGSPDLPVNCVRVLAIVSNHQYALTPTTFAMHNTTNSTEKWKVATNATDSFGNYVVSPTTEFTLRKWPIQTLSTDRVVFGIQNQSATLTTGATFFPDGSTFNWNSATPALNYRINVLESDTGLADQPNNSTNLGLRVFLPGPPAAEVYFNGTTWNKNTNCTPSPGIPRPTTTCTDWGNFTSIGLAGLKSRTGAGGPGRWNITIEVADASGEIRKFNQSFILIDTPPVISDPGLSVGNVTAGGSFLVKANVTDDFNVNHTYVNFTRVTDRQNVSFELTNSTSSTVADGVRLSYNDTIYTGHGAQLGNAGDYDVTFSAVDLFGNWNNLSYGRFTVYDAEKPSLLEAGPVDALQEVGLNVTFAAQATDASNMTVFLQVLRGSEEVFPKVNMTEDPLGEFTFVTNFSTEGNYVWSIWAVDSSGLESTRKSGPLSIRDNLGPRYEVRQPSTKVNQQYYAKSSPQIGILIYDSDGVNKDSIILEVGGEKVAPSELVIIPAGLDTKGFIVNYTVPADKSFDHRDVVTVNVTSIDESEKLLETNTTFTFIVDDVPPTTTLLPFTPRFRADDRNIWNVSLTTPFTILADDNDGLPTSVDAIRYRIIGGGNNAAEAVYTGPFSIKDAPAGIYTGPRVYQIQYWAVDAVGNQNRTFDSITVYVDDLPPQLDPFGSLPQGRFVNATIIDDRSGVDRAVVWWNLNGQTFQPTPLDFTGGLWSTILPEGKKQDRMSYYLQVWDRVNNTDTFGNATNPYSIFRVENHPPVIKITSPTTGSKIQRTVDIVWDARDEDGDPVIYTVYYRAPGKSSFVELAKLEAAGTSRYALDTNRFTDGEYTFRVLASDGSAASSSETTVTILNRGTAIGSISPVPGEVKPGEGVLITAEITKAQAVVEARIFRDGKFVEAYPMNDEGRDGDEVANDAKHSVRVAFDAAGQYSVEIFTRYQEDGQTKESVATNALNFGIPLTPGAIFSTYGGLIAVVGILALAGVGIAAFVLLRRP